MFASEGPAIIQATIITLRAEASERKQWELCELLLYELELLNGSKGALRVMYYVHCAPARTPEHLSDHLGLANGP